MKKKIINGFLMAALMLTATTSFVSCKDNMDDELVGVYNNLAAQKTALEKRISDLETDLNAKIKANSDAIAQNKAAIDKINGEISDIKTKLASIDADIDQMVLEFPIMADYIMLEINGLTIYATHGHKHNEKDPLPLHNHEIMLNGHFHVPACSDHEDWIYMNPGSVSLPKDGSHNSYMMLEDRTFTWYDIETNEVFGEVTVK